jgi:hypothetical protein
MLWIRNRILRQAIGKNQLKVELKRRRLERRRQIKRRGRGIEF